METTLYGPTVGQIVANSWLYWQPALLPGGLWQHFSSIPTFLLPQLLQCRLSEVNIEEVTLKLLSTDILDGNYQNFLKILKRLLGERWCAVMQIFTNCLGGWSQGCHPGAAVDKNSKTESRGPFQLANVSAHVYCIHKSCCHQYFANEFFCTTSI